MMASFHSIHQSSKFEQTNETKLLPFPFQFVFGNARPRFFCQFAVWLCLIGCCDDVKYVCVRRKSCSTATKCNGMEQWVGSGQKCRSWMNGTQTNKQMMNIISIMGEHWANQSLPFEKQHSVPTTKNSQKSPQNSIHFLFVCLFCFLTPWWKCRRRHNAMCDTAEKAATHFWPFVPNLLLKQFPHGLSCCSSSSTKFFFESLPTSVKM